MAVWFMARNDLFIDLISAVLMRLILNIRKCIYENYFDRERSRFLYL